MTDLNIESTETTGKDANGVTFESASGQLYFISKSYNPKVKDIGLLDKQFEITLHSKQQFETLKDPLNAIGSIYRYLTDKPNSFNKQAMISAIADSIKNGNSFVFPKNNKSELFDKPDTNRTGKKDTLLEENGVKKIVPEIVQIIPFRYALDESQLIVKEGAKEHLIEKDPEQWIKLHELPKKGKFKGGYFKGALTKNSYTLRQLTDGWLYVWDNGVGQKLDEYKVEGTQLILCDGGRNAASSGKVYLEYSSKSILNIVFSPVKWSDRLFTEFKDSTSEVAIKRRKWGRKVTCSIYSEDHTGLFEEVIDSVADIGDIDKAIFPLAVPSVADRKSDDENVITGKPVQLPDTYRGALSDPTTARIVAIDDLFSDVNDIVSQVAYLNGLLYENNEVEMAKRVTAKAVVSFCTESSTKKYPGNVTSLTEGDFLKDLNKYYKDREALDTYTGSHYTPYDMKASEATDASYQKLSDDFESTYGFAPSTYDSIKWNLSKHRDYVDFDLAVEFLQSHIKHDRGIYRNIKERLQELMKCHYKIKPDPSFIGIDHFTPDGQSVIMGWMLNSFDVLVPGLDETLLKTLSNALFVDEESKSLISLTFSAFDKEFRSHFLSIIHQLPNDRDLDKMMQWDKDPSSVGITDAELAGFIRNVTGRLKSFITTIDTHDLENNVWTGNLVGPSALAFAALKDSVASASTSVWGLFGNHEIALYSKATAKITNINETGQVTSKLLFGKILRDTFLDPNYDSGIVVNYSARKAGPKTAEEVKAFILHWNDKLGRYLDKLETGQYKGSKEHLLANINKAQEKLAKNLTANPHIIELANPTLEAEHRAVMREQVDNLIKRGGKVVDSGFVYAGIALNLWNVLETPVPDKWALSFNDVDATNSTLRYISNMAYLTQSIIGLQHAKTKTFFKNITDGTLVKDINKDYKILLQLSLREASNMYGEDAAKVLIRSIRNFKMLSGSMGVLGVVAAGTNLRILYTKLNTSSETGLDGMEFNLTLALAATSAIQTIEGAIYISQIFGMLEAAAWVNPLFLVVGIASLLLTFALMYWTRDDIDEWLQHCRFGIKPELRLWDLDYVDQKTADIAVQEEYTSLQHLLLTPNVYAEATYTWAKKVYTGSDYQWEKADVRYARNGQNIITGYWLILYLPGKLTDWEVQIAEVDSNDNLIINPHLSCNPYYLTPEQHKKIKETGLPNNFTGDKPDSTEIVTGLYMFPLELMNKNGEFVLKINLINDPNAYQYRINSKSIYSGSNVEIEKFTLADTSLTPLYLEPMSIYDRLMLAYESLTT
jgi:hypothetical protein